jgi:hypothetical protein
MAAQRRPGAPDTGALTSRRRHRRADRQPAIRHRRHDNFGVAVALDATCARRAPYHSDAQTEDGAAYLFDTHCSATFGPHAQFQGGSGTQ